MAAVMGRTEIQIKKTGQSTTVPNHPTAKLMYYLNCISSCVDASDDPTLRRLTDYRNYTALSSEEEGHLFILCLALSPEKLVGSILFPADDCGGTTNQFFELKAVSTKLVVAESLLIGGQQRRVQKIMMFQKCWIERNYFNPMLSFQRGQRPALPSSSTRRAVSYRGQRSTAHTPLLRQQRKADDSCCIIL